MNPPTPVGKLPTTGKVTTVHSDGSVAVRHDLSRKTWVVIQKPAGWTPAVGDKVVVDHLNGHPLTPAILTVLA